MLRTGLTEPGPAAPCWETSTFLSLPFFSWFCLIQRCYILCEERGYLQWGEERESTVIYSLPCPAQHSLGCGHSQLQPQLSVPLPLPWGHSGAALPVLSAVAVFRMFILCNTSEGTCWLLEFLRGSSPELLCFPEISSGTFSSMPSLGALLEGKTETPLQQLRVLLSK